MSAATCVHYVSDMTNPASLPSVETVAKLHDQTTLLHAFIYFSPEAAEHYAKLGVEGRSGYFGSRTAAMGPLPTEMVIATFYNFSPDLVVPSMDGMWDRISARDLQTARWRGAKQVLDAVVRPAMTDDDIDAALDIAERVVGSLNWSGRPLAAGNAAALADLETGDLASDRLLRLWQLVTVIREWRGDGHIALLLTAPLDGAECTVVSEVMTGRRGVVQKSRAWSDVDWTAAVDRLTERGWLDDQGDLTDHGRDSRAEIEAATNRDSVRLWAAVGNDEALRFGDLIAPATKALLAANYFAAIGRPAR